MRHALLILLFLVSPSVYGKVYITVSGANVKRAKIAVGDVHALPGSPRDPALAGMLAKQVREDLEFMALFDFVDRTLFQSLDQPGDFYKMNYKDWSLLQASFVLKLGYKLEGNFLVLEALFYDVPGESKIFGTRYRFDRRQYHRLVHALAEDVLQRVTGEKGLFFSRVLMVCRPLRGKHPPKEIYVADADGRNLQALTRDKTLSLSPSWSPDGRYITYTQFEYHGVGKKRRKAQALKLHDLTTGKRTVLSARNGVNSGAAWSPDGKQVAATMSYSGRPEIYLINPFNPAKPEPLSRSIQWRRISGTGFQQNSLSTLFDVEPSWSPDGKKMVISSRRTGHPMIYVVDLATRQATQLTFAGTYNSSPAWSPRGDKILFAAQRLIDGNFDLFIIDPDGNNLNRITGGGREGVRKINNENPSWAPTGRHFVYSSNETGNYAIYTTDMEGRIRRRISPDNMECTTPAWGPPTR